MASILDRIAVRAQREGTSMGDWIDRVLRAELEKPAKERPTAQPQPGYRATPVAAPTEVDLIEELDRMGLPNQTGRPTAGKRLRENGISFREEMLAEAIRQRKCRVAAQPPSDDGIAWRIGG